MGAPLGRGGGGGAGAGPAGAGEEGGGSRPVHFRATRNMHHRGRCLFGRSKITTGQSLYFRICDSKMHKNKRFGEPDPLYFRMIQKHNGVANPSSGRPVGAPFVPGVYFRGSGSGPSADGTPLPPLPHTTHHHHYPRAGSRHNREHAQPNGFNPSRCPQNEDERWGSRSCRDLKIFVRKSFQSAVLFWKRC